MRWRTLRALITLIALASASTSGHAQLDPESPSSYFDAMPLHESAAPIRRLLATIQAEGLPILRYWFVLRRSEQRQTGAMQVVWDEIRSHSKEMIRSEEVAKAIAD